MASIFDLKTNPSELSSANEGTSRMMYEQHPPTRDVVGNNFPNGAIHIRFQTSGQKWWVPSRSYIRMRAKLTKPDGTTTLVLSDDVAPNMGLMSNLFQSAEFRIADKTVARVSDYMPQIDALETRLCKSKSWIDSVGESTNWWQDEVKERQSEVVSDVDNSETSIAEVDRLGLGYDAIGQNNSNALFFTFADNKISFFQNGGGALPDNNDVYQVGDVIRIGEVNGNVPALGTEFKITAIDSATVLSVETDNVLGANIGANNDGRIDWTRVRTTAIKNDTTRKLNSFEMTWQPPLSIFKIGHALPAGKYELVLNPQTTTQYRKRAIESLLADKVPTSDGVAGDFDFAVVDMFLYCATVEGPRGDDQTYLLDLEETRCQVDNVDSGGSFQQKNFDVSPSTFALTCAFQDTRAGNLTQYSASKFKIDGVAQDELKLNRLFLNYAGQNRPSPDADPEFEAGRDYTIQRYVESQLYSGGYYDCGGAETITEWHERGAYYYFSFPRDGTDRSTRVNAHFGFSGAIANGRVLIFDHSKKIARVRVQDGRVVDVQIEDA